jgi:hypothetical protein
MKNHFKTQNAIDLSACTREMASDRTDFLFGIFSISTEEENEMKEAKICRK